jgi:hypothetical protein
LVYPCHRAVALTPPEWSGASVSLRRPMRPSLYGRELGFLWVSGLSRPNLRLLSLRPDDLLTILKMALSIGIRNSISLLSAIQATGLLTITLVGLSPTEHTSLFLDTLPDGRISQVRFEVLASRPGAFPFAARFKRWFAYAPTTNGLLSA